MTLSRTGLGLGLLSLFAAAAGSPAAAADRAYPSGYGRGAPADPVYGARPIPDCADHKEWGLLSCTPRPIVKILPGEPVANDVLALEPRQYRPYPQLFIWQR
ncbi:hypothetical protein [uncultured Methylobacterium sp.]|jgi:hypothetical protein|uniref:hypothetical protein n=1 Tax=uncultured Methylobacterium sp. TaxID=157278 RepID=UPI00260CAFE4|nr:hypothetical protein [uncultured Methylobacterium sp.]